MANTGGLLGLCMGFSLVSAFEIVYHCMVTLCWKSFHLYRSRTAVSRSGQKKSVEAAAAGCSTLEKSSEIRAVSQSPSTTPGLEAVLLLPNGSSTCNECQQHKQEVEGLSPEAKGRPFFQYVSAVKTNPDRTNIVGQMCSLSSMTTIDDRGGGGLLRPSSSNGDCNRGRLPPPTSLRKCVLIDNDCKLYNRQLQ